MTISDNARRAAEKIAGSHRSDLVVDGYAVHIQSAMDTATADKDAVIAGLRRELAELKGTQDFREVTGCRDCGKPISIEANQCPHCHHFQ